MKKVTTWILGLALIAVGVIWGINALGIAEINIFFPGWWTLFIIVPSVVDLFQPREDKTGAIVGILIGVCLMLGCLGVVQFSMLWKLLVPAILVLIGASMIGRELFKGKILKKAKKLSDVEHKEYWAVFSGQKLDFQGEVFEGAQFDAVFGGLRCDLREAKIKDGALIKASGVFGGITIFVPDDVEVEVASMAIFGGVSNQHEVNTKKGSQTTLYIDANAVFGGVEIK